MKLIKNTGSDRVVDELRAMLGPASALDLASPVFSLFAFAEIREVLEKLDCCRIVLGTRGSDLGLTGSDNDRAFRNRLNIHWLAMECAAWLNATRGRAPRQANRARSHATEDNVRRQCATARKLMELDMTAQGRMLRNVTAMPRQDAGGVCAIRARTVGTFQELLAALDVIGEPQEFPFPEWPAVTACLGA